VLGTTQSLSIAICQAVVSKDLMHCKSAPRIGKLLGIEDFGCLGPLPTVLLPMQAVRKKRQTSVAN